MTTTTQLTSKTLKAHVILALSLILIGFACIGAGIESSDTLLAQVGAAEVLLGIFYKIVVRVLIWWNHG